jgi:alpha-tubulin suppressor-like RCC1 family protein
LDDWGQLGDGQSGPGTLSATPVRVPFSFATNVSAGADHTCAVKTDHTIWCWGNNLNGQLGIGTTDAAAHPNPLQVPGSGFDAVSTAYRDTCGHKLDNTSWCWGLNDSGSLGTGNTAVQYPSPGEVIQNPTVPLFGTNEVYPPGCARQNTSVYCWGSNIAGNLGNGATDSSSHPFAVMVPNLSDVAHLAVGSANCALKTDGTVWCWGENGDGDLGTGMVGTPAYSAVPVEVLNSPNGSPFTGSAAISGGGNSTCTLKADGSVWCWGNFNDTQHASPIPILLMSGSMLLNAIEVAAGSNHGCALLSDGSIWCWGAGNGGQLGDGGLVTHYFAAPSVLSCP